MSSKPSTSSRNPYKKTILRNPEVSVKCTGRKISILKHPPLTVVDEETEAMKNKIKQNQNTESISKNTQINVKLFMKKPTGKATSQSAQPQSSTVLQEIDARTMTKKLNFPPDVEIFKGLIPINVNDSLLKREEDERKSLRKKYVPRKDKDPIPELSDFLTPIEPLKHAIPLYDKPEVLRKSRISNASLILNIIDKFHPGM